MSNPGRTEYKGPRRKLVLAFDVGTTFSGISYCVLDPGQIPETMGVTRYPAQDYVSGGAKIPTTIYYDRQGQVRAAGAEALCEGIQEMAKEEHWIKSEWFKLHLGPKTKRRKKQIPGDTPPLPLNKTAVDVMADYLKYFLSPAPHPRPKVASGKDASEHIPPLPLNKSVVDVLADYLKYLFGCAATFIQETHTNGTDIWNSVKNEIDYVLSHPNGWEGAQQSKMRRAAVLAGLIVDSPSGHARLSFVTEGEASLHFAINNGLPAAAMKDGGGVVIVDAGGGTVDISSYSKESGVSVEKFDEIAAAQSHFNGSVFVAKQARRFLEKFLADSEYFDDIDHMVERFDKTTKLRFRSSQVSQYIKFGSMRDNDVQHDIRFGQLKLQGSDVALFFQPSIECIVQAVVDQQKASPKSISYIVLLGGFSASDWLFDNVTTALSALNLHVIRPTNHVNKAVADGAISFYLDHFVQTRVSRFVYGIHCRVPYDPGDPEHQRRSEGKFTHLNGKTYINNRFSTILKKDIPVLEGTEFRDSYSQQYASKEDLSFSVIIFCYRGTSANPEWMDIDSDKYTRLCMIHADLYHLPLTPLSNGPHQYFELHFDVVLLLGYTELKAQIAWKDNGIEKRTTPKIVYDPYY